MAATLVWSNEQDVLDVPEQWMRILESLLDITAQTEHIPSGEVSLTFVDDEDIRQLNGQFRGIDEPTDVLSFPMLEDDIEMLDFDESESDVLLGDIVISVPTALRQSEQYGHSIEREVGFLFVHGLLHLLGYDHEDEYAETQMFTKQEAILQKAGLVR